MRCMRYLGRVERMWVMKVAIMSVRGVKQQTQTGWRWASPADVCESPNSRQGARCLPRFYRILDKVPRSKQVYQLRLNERELATLQKRRGCTQLEPPNRVSGTRATSIVRSGLQGACAGQLQRTSPHLTHMQRILNTAFRCACSLERK